MKATELMFPHVKRIRAYFAPVDRARAVPTLFDPAQNGALDLSDPPAPWCDLGWIDDFARTSESAATAVRTGAPAMATVQVRNEVDATLSFAFQSWGKLQISLAGGAQQMNLLAPQTGASAAASGGAAIAAVPLGPATTASVLDVGAAAAASFRAGMLVVVDADCTSTSVGYVGSGVSGAFIKTALTDGEYIRRVSLNVGRVATVSGGLLMLEEPLLAGQPVAGMKASAVVGFCDREGSTFFQEWSGLFVAEGQQGERIFWHYPRLQACAGIAEEGVKVQGGYQGLLLRAKFRALPVMDPCDGERVVCFRSYLPG